MTTAHPSEVRTTFGISFSNVWATHKGLLSSRTFVDAVASAGRIDHDRDALFLEERPAEFFVIRDIRDTDVLALRQDWNHQLGERQHLKWGFEIRQWDSSYDYVNEAELTYPINDPRFFSGERQTEFTDTFSSSQYALYAADRVRVFPRLIAELGLRWDRQSLTDEDELSPWVNLVYDLKSSGVLLAGWGYFYQSQRPSPAGPGRGYLYRLRRW